MAGIILPHKWTSQPQIITPIDRSNPLGAGVQLLLTNIGGKLIDAANPSRHWIPAGTPTTNPYPKGVATALDLGDTYSYTGYSEIVGSIGTMFLWCPRVGASDSSGSVYLATSATYNVVRSNRISSILSRDSSGVLSSWFNTSNRSIVFSSGGTAATIKSFLDGEQTAQTWSQDPVAWASGAKALKVFGYPSDSTYDTDSDVYLLGWSKNAWGPAEAKAFHENPWQIFQPIQRRIWVPAAASSGATGTGALTVAAVTASGAGKLSHTGTGAATIAKITASGAGKLSHTGTGALTTIAATLAGAGVLTHVGTGALTVGAVTASGSGTVSAAGTVTGTGALAIAAITASGAGKLSHTGTGALQSSVVALSGAGVLSHTGTGALTTGVVTADGTGQILTTITGTGALTTGAVTVSGYDVLPVAVTPRGGSSVSRETPKRRQRLIIVEEIDDVEELAEQVQEIIKTEPRKKLPQKVKKPAQPIQESPQAAIDWIGYYQAQLDALRDQQRAEALKRQLENNAQVLRAIVEMQAKNAILAEQEAEYARLREEEDFLLLLMAA